MNTHTVSGTAFRRLGDATARGAARTVPTAKDTTSAECLRPAAELCEDGLITEDEHRKQRQAILDEGL